MNKLNITVCGLMFAATFTMVSCQDVVTYNDGYDDGITSIGAPSITAIYDVEDTEKTIPLTEGAFEDMIMVTGTNLSHVKKIRLNDVEVEANEIYATAKVAYFPIPRIVPGEINNKLYYETEQGNTSIDFTVNIPEVSVTGLYNEFALPGSSVKVNGAFFDLYGFGGGNESSTIMMNGMMLEVDSLTEQYMSVIIPEDATDNSTIVFSWESAGGVKSVSVPYRNTANVLWNLDTPDVYGFWAGTELITAGGSANEPVPLNGSYFRINGSFGAWSWNNLLCGGCDFPVEVVANPSDYWLKFEVNSASGNPFYDSASAGYLIQLNGGQYVWNPSSAGSFNTYGNWCTVRLDLAAVATNGLNVGWNNLFWIMQPNSDWNIDHSFANIRIEKKL
ncbi:glycan-binding surface protein [Phocaeicola sp.]